MLSRKIIIKLTTLLMALVFSLSSYADVTTEKPITVSNPDEAQAVFALIADPQVSNYMLGRYPIFKAASQDLQNADCKFDAVIGVGDMAENGLAEEYSLVADGIGGLDTRYIMASGNHDIRLRLYCQSVERFSGFTNDLNGDESVNSLHYSERINGYKVIVLGSDRTEFEEAYLSDAQLDWLNSEVAAENGKPVFVILHQPLKNSHNVEVAWNSPIEGGGTVGPQSDAIKAILSKYENVFLISGHLHSGFGPDSYNNIDGIHSINCPSMSIENKDGTYNNAGTGYIVEVYEDEIIFRARDYVQGTWVAETENDPSYDIVLPVE
ncbi:MAG: metallophosphoesterase [Clostridia bacterium]|nr:metallophosphoesterase [Clostridia bacterium]